EVVASMAPGSVIVDLAGERGGNCELTCPGEIVVEHGVTIIGWFNLASTVPYHASQMYARNVSAFLLHLVKDGKLQLDVEDEIIRETMLTRSGEVVNARVREFFSLPPLPAQPKEVAQSGSWICLRASTLSCSPHLSDFTLSAAFRRCGTRVRCP